MPLVPVLAEPSSAMMASSGRRRRSFSTMWRSAALSASVTRSVGVDFDVVTPPVPILRRISPASVASSTASALSSSVNDTSAG
jgi:hypothetical protein